MDSVSSISESKAQTRVRYSRAEDSDSSAYAPTRYKVFVLDSSFVMLLYTKECDIRSYPRSDTM